MHPSQRRNPARHCRSLPLALQRRQLKDLMNQAEKPKGRKKIAAEMTAFHKWLDEYHPADPKIEVSAVENKV
jgi:hypothetical protein